MKARASRLWMAGLATALTLFSASAQAVESLLNGISIVRIRAVGDYSMGNISDSTLEIWFNGPITYAAGSQCNSQSKVFIDARHKHLISVALLAMTTGRKVHINVDDTLPIRYGACEVSFIDIDP